MEKRDPNGGMQTREKMKEQKTFKGWRTEGMRRCFEQHSGTDGVHMGTPGFIHRSDVKKI